MEKETGKATKVEELKFFPFGNFQEFQRAVYGDIVRPGVDPGIALKWAQGGIYAPAVLTFQIMVLSLCLPHLPVIGFIVYAIATKTWLLLLALPILYIGFYVLHPAAAAVFGLARMVFIGLILAASVWAWSSGRIWLLAITVTLLVVWLAGKAIYRVASFHLNKALVQHEDLLCLFWQNRALRVRFPNGDDYGFDFRTEDGRIISYDDISLH
jgi:hypothetical protein